MVGMVLEQRLSRMDQMLAEVDEDAEGHGSILGSDIGI
jgi:hypothetical protein